MRFEICDMNYALVGLMLVEPALNVPFHSLVKIERKNGKPVSFSAEVDGVSFKADSVKGLEDKLNA